LERNQESLQEQTKKNKDRIPLILWTFSSSGGCHTTHFAVAIIAQNLCVKVTCYCHMTKLSITRTEAFTKLLTPGANIRENSACAINRNKVL
jgi:hypothetical protein